MRTKRTIAVLIMLMLMALPTFVPGVYAEEKTVTVSNATDFQREINDATDNIKVILANSITQTGVITLNTKEGVTYTIESQNTSDPYNILSPVKERALLL